MARERGLICCSERVRAFREGRQTQWREPIDLPQDVEWQYTGKMVDDSHRFVHQGPCGMTDGCCFRKPRYQVGDHLYLKEAFRCTGGGSWKGLLYRADGEDTVRSHVGVNDGRARTLPESLWPQWDHYVYETNTSCGWRSASTMPKWAARQWQEVTAVKDPHRIQDISRADAKAEGFWPGMDGLEHACGRKFGNAELAFAALWDRLHPKPGERFEDGPWVFPYVLEKIGKGD